MIAIRSMTRVLLGLFLAGGLLAGASAAERTMAAGDAGLQQALSAAGWGVERESDGTLKLIPPGQALPQKRTESSPVVHAQDQRVDSIEELKHRLEPLGWKAEHDAEGSLILYPPGDRTSSAAKVDTATGSTTSGSTATIPKGLDRLLEQRGWGVSRSADGSLILVPAGAGATTTGELVPVRPCPGLSLEGELAAAVQLPVGSWAEAKRIAQAWLDASGEPDLLLGRIRKILKVFVVSIVEDSKPFRLRHQLAIRSDDGHVILLN